MQDIEWQGFSLKDQHNLRRSKTAWLWACATSERGEYGAGNMGALEAHDMFPKYSFGNPRLSQNKTVRRVTETFTPHDMRFVA